MRTPAGVEFDAVRRRFLRPDRDDARVRAVFETVHGRPLDAVGAWCWESVDGGPCAGVYPVAGGARGSCAGDLATYRGDPRGAWEALAARGLVPEAWVEDRGRRFVGPDSLRHLLNSGRPGVLRLPPRALDDGPDALSRWPLAVSQAAALAADARGVATAEAVAREACRLPRATVLWETLDVEGTANWRRWAQVDDPRDDWLYDPRYAPILATGYVLGGFGDDAILLLGPVA